MTALLPLLRRPLNRCLLGMLLALPLPALSAVGGDGPTGGGMSSPSATPSSSSCTPTDGGDPQVSPCGSSSPASLDNNDGVDQGVGNPIDVITGNKYQRETDLPALPGMLGLEIVRHYNSALAGTDAPLGLLGRGWRLSYETDLYLQAREVHIVQADGRRLVFLEDRQRRGHYVSAMPGQGRVALIASNAGQHTRYRWTWPDGRTLDFDGRGKLLQIRRPTGEFVSLTRGPRGELMKVTDPQGRSLSFEYAPRDTQGFRGVIAITSPVGRFTYTHQNDRKLPGLSNLTSARHPAGRLHRYHYGADAGEAAATRPHHLTGISLAASAATEPEKTLSEQRLSSYAYDREGRAVMSVRGPARRLDEAGKVMPNTGVEQVELDFSKPGQTVLTNSLGQRTTYRHTRIGGEPRLLEVLGPGCARCGETNVRYGYDRRGQRIRTTRLDLTGQPYITALIERDPAGRVLREFAHRYRDGQPQPKRLIARYAYVGDSAQPVLIAQPSVVRGQELQRRYTYNDAGQITQFIETGFSPLDATGEPAKTKTSITPIERTTTYTYTQVNGRSLLAAIDGPLPNGPIASPIDSDVTTFEWDARGNQIIGLMRAGGRHSTLDHHPGTGLLKRVTHAAGLSTTFSHDLYQQLISVRSEGPGWIRPHEQRLSYDALGRPIESLNALQPAANWRQAWDERGRLQWRASALGILDLYGRDTEGRLIERAQHSAHFVQLQTLRYDAFGRLESVVDNAGRGRQWRYDALGRLQSAIDTDGVIHEAITAPPASLTNTSRPAATKTLHDDFGRAVYQHHPDSGTVVRSYDAADRLIAMRDARGNHARYDYDARGRIQRQQITDARSNTEEETRWHYAGSRLIGVDHPTQRERYEYDTRGLRTARIVTLPTDHGELTAITRYEHDEAGQLVARTLPDGSRLRLVRNGLGQLVALKREVGHLPGMQWMVGEQRIVSNVERDLFGLRRYLSGNGVQTELQRSREGVLGGMVHRPASADAPAALLDHRYIWDVRGNLLHSRQRAHLAGAQPGAVSHAYDHANRLLASVQWRAKDGGLTEDGVWRFAYDRSQRRVLSQQNVSAQNELRAGTERSAFEPGTHRLLFSADRPTRYSASGQPEQVGEREYLWDARGRLTEVREHGSVVSRYGYDHRGLRNTKRAAGRTTHTLYDEHRQPLAELDDRGRILRQYIWLAGHPVAVIDTPRGAYATAAPTHLTSRFASELRSLANKAFGPHETIAWLHNNHLGAPELATGADGKVLWRAHYAPFGDARIQSEGLTLNLRLPGQYFDAETGLHYNRARYYDPAHGQYLTPDPLGTPDGPNPYAYVAFNPLRHVDPDGLILFAFDGTGNSDDRNDPAMADNGLSNVVSFFDAYQDNKRYVSGVGTTHRDIEYGDIRPEDYATHTLLWWLTPGDPTFINDMGGNYSGPARIDRMMLYLRDEADLFEDDQVMDIDIVGFSRGAAQARDFANRITAEAVDYGGSTYYSYTKKDGSAGCQPVNFRFMGLFDTVLSTNFSGTSYNLAIPAAFGHVAQAVALNEHRSGRISEFAYRNPKPNNAHWGGFPLESIGGGNTTAGQTRIEKGFIGAHADIGGGYRDEEQGLSLVALNWMVAQARGAGITIRDVDPIPDYAVVLHDESNVIQAGNPGNVIPRTGFSVDAESIDYVFAEDRDVRGAYSGSLQREMGFSDGSMIHSDTAAFITWLPRDISALDTGSALDPKELRSVTGTVNMKAYLQWLCANNYFNHDSDQCESAGATQ